MGVVRREALRRWSMVAGGVAVLCLLPAAVAAWPVSAASVDPVELRRRVLASADRPYEGYVATDGRIGLPELPQLEEVGALFGGSMRLRAWYGGPAAWRVAELAALGERDTYRAAPGRYRWDFERNLVTFVAGDPAVWLPGPPDLLPPALARRLLGVDGDVRALPARRVAGVAAAGVRLAPADPETSVGRIDVWADPDTGLPVRVEVAGRGAVEPVFTSRFLQLRQATPAAAVLVPTVPDGAGFTMTSTGEVIEALAGALPGELPASLAGRPRSTPVSAVTGGAAYGADLSTVVVLGLAGRLGGRMLETGRNTGGAPVPLTAAEAYELRGSLLAALVVHDDDSSEEVHTWLLAGLVDPQVLRDAAAELVAGR
jgi:hypothetical protein